MNQSRRVVIVKQDDSYFVRYLDRRKNQRYCAAQFDGRYVAYDQVVAWIKSKNQLTLEGEKI